MDRIAKNRLLAGTFAALVLAVALGVLSCSGGSDDPEAEPTTEGSASPTAAASPSLFGSNDDDRPAIGHLDCFALMTDEAVEAALGIEDLPFEERGTIGQGEGEACAKRHRSSEFAFVQLEPGHPLDFDPTTELLGVTGEEVPGVGDGARWFGGPAAEGGGTFGALVVRQETEKGWLHFHVLVSRPDLTPPEVLETAKTFALATLPRFPGVVAAAPDPTATPEPVEIRVEHEPIDRSSFSYLDNLLQKEADGEWTLGEGLVATLRLFLGDVDASEVLRHGEVGFTSATTIIAMARDYQETGSDPDARAEVEALLGRLTPAEPPGSSTESTSALRRASQTVSMIGTQESADDSCWRPWPDSDPCWEEVSTFSENVYRRPILTEGDEWEGWNIPALRARVTNVGADTLKSIRDMGGVRRKLIFIPAPASYAASYMTLDDLENCHIVLGRDVLAQGDTPTARQLIALQVAHCFVATNYPVDGWGSGSWWRDALAWYLSDVAQPRGQLEHLQGPLIHQLEGEELNTPLLRRSFTNMAFFLDFHHEKGMAAIAAFVRESIPRADTPDWEQLGDLLHGYARNLGNGLVFDQGGDEEYDPPAEIWADLAPRQIYLLEPETFGVVRVHVIPPDDEYACLSYKFSDLPPNVSWRYGAPESAGDWSGIVPSWIDKEATFLATSHTAGTWVAITVEDISEEEDCEEDDEPFFPSIGFPSLCPFCDPSDYFHTWTFD